LITLRIAWAASRDGDHSADSGGVALVNAGPLILEMMADNTHPRARELYAALQEMWVHGEAEVAESQAHFGPGLYLVITPKVDLEWGNRRPAGKGGSEENHLVSKERDQAESSESRPLDLLPC